MQSEREEPGYGAERSRVYFVCAAVTLLFGFADTAALGRFSLAAFLVRVGWAAAFAAVAILSPRLSLRSRRWLVMALGVGSSAAFVGLVRMTGGAASPSFHWIFAMPVVIAVVIQEFPIATLLASLVTVAGGVWLHVEAGTPPAQIAQWSVLALSMCGLAGYASWTYLSLRRKERAGWEARVAALDEQAARISAEEGRRDAERAERRARFLEQLGRVLLGATHPTEASRLLAGIVVPAIADGCVVWLSAKGGGPHMTALHSSPARQLALGEAAELLLQHERLPILLSNRRAELVFERDGDGESERHRLLRRLGFARVKVLPLPARGVTLGWLILGDEDGRSSTDSELHLAEELGERAALFIDNTRLFEEAQAAVRARDDFLSIAAHELRTPITSAALQIGLLERMAGSASPDELGRKAELIHRQLGRLSELVQKLLDVSRLASGRLALTPELVDLAEVTREVSSRFSEEARRAGCALRVTTPAGLVGEWDRLRLEQVVTNLLSNALKYGAGAPVELELRADGATVELQVRDHGIGIPVEAQQRIFERFERAVSGRRYGGLGLGLWIVRSLLDAMGGTVTVYSEPSRGSTFTVRLPRLSAPELPVDGDAGDVVPPSVH